MNEKLILQNQVAIMWALREKSDDYEIKQDLEKQIDRTETSNHTHNQEPAAVKKMSPAKDLALTTLQLLVNGSGAEFEDQQAAVAILEELINQIQK